MKKIIAVLIGLLVIATVMAATFTPRLQKEAERHKMYERINLVRPENNENGCELTKVSGLFRYAILGDNLYIQRLYVNMLPKDFDYLVLKVGGKEIEIDMPSSTKMTYCRQTDTRYETTRLSTSLEMDFSSGCKYNKVIKVFGVKNSTRTKILEGKYKANFCVAIVPE